MVRMPVVLSLPALLVARQVYVPRYAKDATNIVRVLVTCERAGSEYLIFRLVSLTSLTKLSSLNQTRFGIGTPRTAHLNENLSPSGTLYEVFSPKVILGSAAQK